MTTFRVFVIGDGDKYNRNCVRIFKNEQLIEAKNFVRKYAAESQHGAIVEIIMYCNGKAEKRVYAVRRK